MPLSVASPGSAPPRPHLQLSWPCPLPVRNFAKLADTAEHGLSTLLDEQRTEQGTATSDCRALVRLEQREISLDSQLTPAFKHSFSEEDVTSREHVGIVACWIDGRSINGYRASAVSSCQRK